MRTSWKSCRTFVVLPVTGLNRKDHQTIITFRKAAKMPLSGKARELIRLEYAQLVSRLGRQCREDIDRLRQTMQRGGGMIKAVDDRHVANLEQSFDALCDLYIDAFARDDARMTMQDIEQITEEMTASIRALRQSRAELEPRSVGLGFHDSLSELIPQMRHKLVVAMKRSELERERAAVARVQRSSEMEHKTVYNIAGNNARVNINSTDSSVNIVTVESQQLFTDIRSLVQREVTSPETRDELLRHVDALQSAVGTSEYLSGYQKFVAVLADHISLFQAFLPALSQLIT